MTIEIVGRLAFLAIGITLLLIAGVLIARGKVTRGPWIWIFGFVCAGTGVYGPAFGNEYTGWMKILLHATDTQESDAQRDVLALIGNGTVPSEYHRLVIANLLENPVPDFDMQAELDEAIANATDPDGKKVLEATKETWVQRLAFQEQLLQDYSQNTTRITEGPDASLFQNTSRLRALAPITREAVMTLQVSDPVLPGNNAILLDHDQRIQLRHAQPLYFETSSDGAR